MGIPYARVLPLDVGDIAMRLIRVGRFFGFCQKMGQMWRWINVGVHFLRFLSRFQAWRNSIHGSTTTSDRSVSDDASAAAAMSVGCLHDAMENGGGGNAMTISPSVAIVSSSKPTMVTLMLLVSSWSASTASCTFSTESMAFFAFAVDWSIGDTLVSFFFFSPGDSWCFDFDRFFLLPVAMVKRFRLESLSRRGVVEKMRMGR